METLITAVYLVGMLAAPVGGYLLAARKPRASRLDLLRGATLGGAVLGALLALVGLTYLVAFGGPPAVEHQLTLVLYLIISCTASGAAVGAFGLVARAIGRWRGAPEGSEGQWTPLRLRRRGRPRAILRVTLPCAAMLSRGSWSLYTQG